MDPRSPTKIAVIGSGLMGSALARAFAAAGHDVAVWNRTPSKAQSRGRWHGRVGEPGRSRRRDERWSSSPCPTTPPASELFSAKGVARGPGRKDARSAHQRLPRGRSRGTGVGEGTRRGLPGRRHPRLPGLRRHRLRDGLLRRVASPVFDRHLATLQAIAKNSVYVDEKIGSAATLDCAILGAYYGGSLAVPPRRGHVQGGRSGSEESSSPRRTPSSG